MTVITLVFDTTHKRLIEDGDSLCQHMKQSANSKLANIFHSMAEYRKDPAQYR